MNKKDEYINAMDEIRVSEDLKRKTMNRIKEKKQIKFPYKLVSAMTVVLVLFLVIFMSDSNKLNELTILNEPMKQANINLPKVENVDNLLKILENVKYNNVYNSNFMLEESVLSTDSVKAINGKSDSYSITNVQVAGVDEADIVKTDGEYIYYITGNKLVIAKAGDDLKIVREIQYEVQDAKVRITPQEMYINNNRLIVILNKYEEVNYRYSGTSLITECCYYLPMDSKTEIINYDITDKENPSIYKSFEIDGSYISSRMVNDTAYVITEKLIYKNDNVDATVLKEEDIVQKYYDSTRNLEKHIKLADIAYIPESESNNYLNIIAMDTQSKSKAKISTILGAGHEMYANNKSIYLTLNKYNYDSEENNSYNNTKIYKFKIDKLNIEYVATGEVSGRILNQFSMDEYNDNFRIAVTQNGNKGTVNSLYVLGKDLKVIGKVENLAENESIYSVRFMGEKGYIVTFREIDPLFVIDLKNPEKPEVLGELKIPGYSSYLHPYDENYIIGIGEDVEIRWNSEHEFEYTELKGIKVSMFDVSNPREPKELFNKVIGENSYSSVLNNHKALLFDRKKNIIAFPIELSYFENGMFFGAIVFDIDLENGFSERGRISHNNDNYKIVDRIIYIGNDFYTLSKSTIRRTDMNTMQELGKVDIEYKEGIGYYESMNIVE